jgi:AraC family carnitine catabolism transcriptional activator
MPAALLATMPICQETIIIRLGTPMAQKIGFLLLPRFSMLSLMSALEPLRVANRYIDDHYEWQFIGASNTAVTASNGIPVSVTAMSEVRDLGRLFVCASYAPQAGVTPSITQWLKHRGRTGAHIGALESGCHALAAADLLNNHSTALHWESQAAFHETYPHLQLSNDIFNDDGKRFTCAGGSACLDLVLHQITQDHNRDIADQVARCLIHQRQSEVGTGQDSLVMHTLQQKRLSPVIDAMAAHIEDPLDGPELAAIQKVSERTLQRQFKQAFGMPPRSCYLQMRLQRARQLLHESNLSVMQVGIACGFGSNENFCRQYKTMYGHPPSRDRKMDIGMAAYKAIG